MQTTEMILVRRGYLVAQLENEDYKYAAYHAAKLLNTFGVMVDKPRLTSLKHVKLLSNFYGINVPRSFYSNPQDLKHFSSEELIIEQIVSYINVEWIDGVESEDPETFKRIELFKKALPDYEPGKEVVFRNYKIIDSEEMIEVLKEIGKNLASYTRGWSETEYDEFTTLFSNGFVDQETVVLMSKDNAIQMFELTKLPTFAKYLDQKDVVKMSISMIGEVSNLKFTSEQERILRLAIENCKPATLSKKQAKFFSQLTNRLTKRVKVNNNNSPYKKATSLINKGQVVEAAKIFARNGSLLERNLVWLLSRAKTSELQQIIDLLNVKNPIVAVQLLESVTSVSNEPRTFVFYNNRRVKSHSETEHEAKYRKSILSNGVKSEVTAILCNKIDAYYENLPKLGKVYIGEIFKDIPLPFNTSASGSGIDVLPFGSRLNIAEPNIRAFAYWNNIYDVDLSATLIRDNDDIELFDYRTFYNRSLYGNSLLHSGDNRSNKGSEYIDIRLNDLVERGFKYVIISVHGFHSEFNKDAEVYTGFQIKNDLDTRAWQPNNIQMKMKAYGDSRAFSMFGIDLVRKQAVALNQMLESNGPNLDKKNMFTVKRALDSRMAEMFSIDRIARLRATEIVNDPSDADIVFDTDYLPTENQKLYKPSDIEKLVALLN